MPSTVLAFITMIAHPIEMKARAVKSYFIMNFSLSINIDQKIAAIIPIAEVVANNVRLRNYTK